MKLKIISATLGAIGGAIAYAYGGWTESMMTLLIFMAIDYLSGLVRAGVFKASNKSEGGALDSKAGFKGLCRKGFILLVVLIAYRLDLLIGTTYIKDATIIAFIVNELISIIENLGAMGVPMPEVIVNAIEVLKEDKKHE